MYMYLICSIYEEMHGMGDGSLKFSSALGLSNIRNMMNMPLSCIHNPRRPDAGPFSFLSGGN